MTQYAQNTEVSVDKSKAEIERILARYGASDFGYMWSDHGTRVRILFRLENRNIRFDLPMPPKKDFEYTETGKPRKYQDTIDKAWEQACRQRWRALVLVIKAKLEAIESGITTFADEFLAATLLTDGRTVGEWAGPQVEHTYQTGEMPPLLPGITSDAKMLSERKAR